MNVNDTNFNKRRWDCSFLLHGEDFLYSQDICFKISPKRDLDGF